MPHCSGHFRAPAQMRSRCVGRGAARALPRETLAHHSANADDETEGLLNPHFSLPFEKVSRCPRTSLGQRDGGSKSFLPRARSRGRAAKGVTASPQGAYASVRLTAAAALFTPASPFPKKSFAPQNLFWEPYPMDLLGGEQALSWQDGRVVVHAQRRLPCGKG